MAALKIRMRLGSTGLLLLVTFSAVAQTRIHQRRNSSSASDYAKSDLVVTEISPSRCRRLSSAASPELRDCGGIGGYRLLYAGPEEKPEIIIVTPDRKRFPITYWDLAAANFVSLSTSVEWRFIRSPKQVIPLALILQATIKPDEFSRFAGPYTILAKLTPNEACTVGRVPGGPDSSGITVSLIIAARFRHCVDVDNIGERDWLGVVFGLVSKGRYEEAKSTIKLIKSPSSRAVAYADVARSQAAGGDAIAARATLLAGLDDVQKKQNTYEDAYGGTVNEGDVYRINLLTLIAAMTRVGLYADAKATIRFLDLQDLHQALVMVAAIQGGHGESDLRDGRDDLQAAKVTFQQAIDLNLRDKDNAQADGHLVEIIETQARVGLIEDARKTLLLIKSPQQREIATAAIARYNAKPN
jgi:hypothetical protein